MSRRLLLALLFGTLLACATLGRAQEDVEVGDDDEDDDREERAVLIVRRAVADTRPLENKQTTVTISIYNAGSATATDVKLREAAWPADAFSVEGSLTASFDKIPEGASVQHTYKLTGKEPSSYLAPGTVVSYIPGEDESEQTTTAAPLNHRTFSVLENLLLKGLELGSTLSGGTLNSLQDWRRLLYVAVAGSVAFFGYRSYTSVSASNANRRRAKALAALGELEKSK